MTRIVRFGLDLKAADGRPLHEGLSAAGDAAAIAVTAALGATADAIKLDWRAAIRNAGLGERLPNAVGSNVYPSRGRYSLRAAGTVFARGDRAAAIFQGLTTGGVIRGRGGRWLAIPTNYAPKQAGGRDPTPESVEQRFGRPLRFVYLRRTDFALLVMDDVTAARSGRGLRNATRRRRAQGRKAGSVVMFRLIPEARLRKLLDFDAPVARRMDELPALIERLLPEE